mmetsp:Transcript_60362/g.118760  ORF Transcript_60362/g.118760 Transcript_60362/m.118760 type:complete len:225 (+) Transcript_60362:845-1519(+)
MGSTWLSCCLNFGCTALSSPFASGCDLMWLHTTWSARRSSWTGSDSSRSTARMSNRLRMGSVRLTFCAKVRCGSYLPSVGFATATTAQRAFSVATMPALDTEIVCCSMASCKDVRSLSFILSNSSMRHMPSSANTIAPPSKPQSPFSSRVTAAVRPTALAPLPVVYTARGKVDSTYLRNWDFAKPGSPTMRLLMSPRILCLPAVTFCWPPIMLNAIAVLTCFIP